MALRYTKISCNAFNPVKGSNLAAGYDLRSAYDYVVPAKKQALCQTDLKICLPNGCYGRIAPRSGLALKNSIHVGGGVIDADYRGNVGVILLNLGDSDFIVKQGDRIAQLICEKIYYPQLEEVTELDSTERRENGYGSTGIN